MAKLKSQLNEQQQIIVDNIHDNLLLLAGAGTGKTNTLAHRVSSLIELHGADPKRILCLTFTNRACKELTDRIELAVGICAKQTTIKTIHSFCAQLLRDTPVKLKDIPSDFTVCDEDDCAELIRELIEEKTGRSIDPRSLGVLQRFIAVLKDHWLEHPEIELSGLADYVFTHHSPDIRQICVSSDRSFDEKFFRFLCKYGASIFQIYQRQLSLSHLLDFSDLLVLTAKLLCEPEASVYWKSQFDYVHVDEVQDTSLAEYNLLRTFCEKAVTLFCGDFNQTIYEWRGSDPSRLISRYTADFHPLTVHFTINYRSSGQLLAVAENFLWHAFSKGSSSGFDPFSEPCGDISLCSFETTADEIHHIYQTICGLGLTDYSRVAIITRTNKACAEVCDLLKTSALKNPQNPVSFMLSDDLKLFRRTEIKDLLALISLLCNPQDSQSLSRILKKYVPGISSSTIRELQNEKKHGIALPDFIDLRTYREWDFFAPLLKALSDSHVVVFDVESTGTDVFSDEIIQIAGVKLDPDGNVIESFEQFIKPQIPVGDSERIHHFSDEMLAEIGRPAADVLTEFLAFSSNCVLIGHNVNFDINITKSNLSLHGIHAPFSPAFYDTLDLSRRFLPDLPNYKLITVSETLGATHEPTHNAMDDILATAQVLRALTEQFIRPQSAARKAVYQKHCRKFEDTAKLIFSIQQRKVRHVSQLLELLIDAFSVRDIYHDEEERLENIELFCTFAREYANDTQPLVQQLFSLLEMSALAASEPGRFGAETGKVSVITAHQAKGCEYDHVFLPMLQQGVFPTFQAVKKGDLTEEKRVFYVSLTRAKRKLYLSHARYNNKHYTCDPSVFLSMIGP